MQVRRPRSVDLLRLLLIASVAVPTLLFVLVAWTTYRTTFADAQHDLDWTSEVAREHAAKVFDSYKLVADRVADVLGSKSDDEIHVSEDRLSRDLRGVIAGLPQIESLIVLDRSAHLLVATNAMPVDRSTDFADRDYFQALKASGVSTFISRVQVSRVSGRVFFGWGRARHDAYGAFAGVIDIAVSPRFLQNFYTTLLSEVGASPAGSIVTMIRTDGQILVRQPGLLGPQPMIPSTNPFFAAILANPVSGSYSSRSLIDPGAPERMFAYRKVPGHPVYIVAGRSLEAISGEWTSTMLRYLAFGIPGTTALFLVTLVTLRGAGRERTALAQLTAEMNRREAAEGQLRQAQKMEAIGQLTGGIAHDFNNLLTVIRSSVDLMRRPNLSEERRTRYVMAIADTTERATRLTGQLLAFARRQALKPEVFDVVGNVSSLVEMVGTLIGPGIAIETRLPNDALFINADPNQFDACLINLAVNARDAMGGKGHLVIAVGVVDALPALRLRSLVPGDYVTLSVTDDGSGVATDHLDKMFEPFFTTKRKGEGTGLGLSQVFGFTTQSGGDVAVESSPGRGATFILYLPRVDAPAVPPGVAHEQGREPGSLAMRLLVVEDDLNVGASVTEVLADLGCASILVADAHQALNVLSTDRDGFDLVFSDVVMPGMSGIDFGQEVRRLYHDLPVLLTSGYSEVLAQEGSHGFELLHKPYSAEDLSRVMQKSVSRHQSRLQETCERVEEP